MGDMGWLAADSHVARKQSETEGGLSVMEPAQLSRAKRWLPWLRQAPQRGCVARCWCVGIASGRSLSLVCHATKRSQQALPCVMCVLQQGFLRDRYRAAV